MISTLQDLSQISTIYPYFEDLSFPENYEQNIGIICLFPDFVS